MTDSLPIAAAAPPARTASPAMRSERDEAEMRGARRTDDSSRRDADFGAAYSASPEPSNVPAGERRDTALARAGDIASDAAEREGAVVDKALRESPAQTIPANAAPATEDSAAQPAPERPLLRQGAHAPEGAPTAQPTDAMPIEARAATENHPAQSGDTAQTAHRAAAVAAPVAADGANAAAAPTASAPAPAPDSRDVALPPRGADALSAPQVRDPKAAQTSVAPSAAETTFPPSEATQARSVAPTEDPAPKRGETTPNGAAPSQSRVEIASAGSAGGGVGGDPSKGGQGTDPGKAAAAAVLSGPMDGEAAPLPAGEGRDAASLRPAAAAAEAPRPDAPRPAMAQIVEAVRLTRDGAVEVALNPEELGRVRLSLSGGDGALHVQIQSDRPETADLLRRHIAQLQDDLRALGYGDVSFAFGSDARNAGGTAAQSGPDMPEDAEPPTTIAVATPALDAMLRAAGGGGLDLRF